MYKRMKLEGIVRIPPDQMGNPLEETVEMALRNKYEAVVDKTLGTIVAVLGADRIGEGQNPGRGWSSLLRCGLRCSGLQAGDAGDSRGRSGGDSEVRGVP